MSKRLRWTIVALGALLGAVVTAAAVLYFVGGARLNRSYDVAVPALVVSTNDTASARGRHLAEGVTGCHGCHGDRLEGDVLVDEPFIATIYASNLTSGQGGVDAMLLPWGGSGRSPAPASSPSTPCTRTT